MDGRGVAIRTGKFVQIGYWKNETGHGPYMSVNNEDQVRTDGSLREGKLDGRFTYTLPNGTVEVEIYDDGNFMGIDVVPAGNPGGFGGGEELLGLPELDAPASGGGTASGYVPAALNPGVSLLI